MHLLLSEFILILQHFYSFVKSKFWRNQRQAVSIRRRQPQSVPVQAFRICRLSLSNYLDTRLRVSVFSCRLQGKGLLRWAVRGLFKLRRLPSIIKFLQVSHRLASLHAYNFHGIGKDGVFCVSVVLASVVCGCFLDKGIAIPETFRAGLPEKPYLWQLTLSSYCYQYQVCSPRSPVLTKLNSKNWKD